MSKDSKKTIMVAVFMTVYVAAATALYLWIKK
jgi:hypothetical protein